MAPALSAEPSPAAQVQEALSRARTPMFLQLQGRVLEELSARFPAEGPPLESLVEVLAGLDAQVAEIAAHVELQEAVVRSAPTQEAYERGLLETARYLGASPRELEQDRAALRRWLDWDALLERARRRSNRLRRLEQLGVTALGQLLAELEEPLPSAEVSQLLLEGLESLRHPLVEREYVQAAGAALACLEAPEPLAEALFKIARDPRRDLWSQRHALEALVRHDPSRGLQVAEGRLLRPVQRSATAFYLRRFILDECLARFEEPQRLELIEAVLTRPDPSAHVRQGAVLALTGLGWERGWETCRACVLENEAETCVEVSASASLVLEAWALAATDPAQVLQRWSDWLAARDEPLIVRIGLSRLRGACEALVAAGSLPAAVALRIGESLVRAGAARGWDVPTRRRAEDLLASAAISGQASFAALAEDLAPSLRALPAGEALDLVCSREEVPPQDLGHFLAWVSRESEGFYAEPRAGGYRITARGRPVLRAWRLWHELRNPAPDKRQGHPTGHVRGWLRPGAIRAHSALLGEESPTRIPGEPVVCREEGSWRRFLPLVDDFLDALGRERVTIYSSEGVVEITPPRGLSGWRAWARITLRYPRLSALRNEVRLGNPELDPAAYVAAFRELGFEVAFSALGPEEASSVAAYFASSAPADEGVSP